MKTPKNSFKANLGSNRPSTGLWVALSDSVAAEIASTAGFDWLVIDAEHAPNDTRTLLTQLQAVSAYRTSLVARPLQSDAARIKQLLDLGFQTILAPMVETADQASELVKATRYPPPNGIRGVTTARAARWGHIDDYWDRADDEICLVVQVETIKGVENIADIAATDGVDAVFVGPSDLAADMGYLGRANAEVVTSYACSAIKKIRAAGKPAGTLGVTADLANLYISAGATFVGVGVDTIALSKALTSLAQSLDRYKEASG